MRFFEKARFFFKICRGGKIAAESVSNDLFRQNVFPTLIVRFFLQKNQITFKFGKVTKFDEERIFFFWKKTLSSF